MRLYTTKQVFNFVRTRVNKKYLLIFKDLVYLDIENKKLIPKTTRVDYKFLDNCIIFKKYKNMMFILGDYKGQNKHFLHKDYNKDFYFLAHEFSRKIKFYAYLNKDKNRLECYSFSNDKIKMIYDLNKDLGVEFIDI